MAAPMRPVSLLLLSNRRLLLNARYSTCIMRPQRFISSSTTYHGKTPQVNSPAPTKVGIHVTMEKPPASPGVMARFENKLETKYPRVYKVYILIKTGIKDFYVDTKTLYSVSSEVWKGKSLEGMSYNQLDVYRRMPKDLLRVGPIVVLLNLPITDIIMPFFVIAFPRYLLSQHFWTAEQQSAFGEKDLWSQVPHMPTVLHAMDTKSMHMDTMAKLVSKLKEGTQVTVEEVLEAKPVFQDNNQFGLPSLQYKSYLARTLGFSTFNRRLIKQTRLLHYTDLALRREGIKTLSPLKVKQACFVRGLNASKCSNDEATKYLEMWTTISQYVDDKSLSLLLHCPTLLGINHPANAALLNQK